MRYVEPRVPRAAAIRFFERRRLSNLYRLFRRRSSMIDHKKWDQRLPRLEQIWLPYYLITFRVTSRKGPGEVDVSVEAYSGSFAFFQMREVLEEGSPEGETFPPKLAAEAAIESGRKDLLRAIMRRRGQFGKPVVEEALQVELFHYPLWVYYYQRARQFIDIRVQDAITGEKAGQRTRVGVLSAMAGPDGSAAAVLDQLR
jgi:hypothetical protein